MGSFHLPAVTVSGKLLSGEEEGLEDDPEKAELRTSSFTGRAEDINVQDVHSVIDIKYLGHTVIGK